MGQTRDIQYHLASVTGGFHDQTLNAHHQHASAFDLRFAGANTST
jgi:hypothetical protein